MIHDENEYSLLRQQLLHETTIDENKRAARIARQYDFNNFDAQAIDPLVKEKLLKRREKCHALFLHYTHEKRFASYKRAIHQLWAQTFRDTTAAEARLIVSTRNNPNLTRELVRRCPFPRHRKRTVPTTATATCLPDTNIAVTVTTTIATASPTTTTTTATIPTTATASKNVL